MKPEVLGIMPRRNVAPVVVKEKKSSNMGANIGRHRHMCEAQLVNIT
jgi:hypothetical protein